MKKIWCDTCKEEVEIEEIIIGVEIGLKCPKCGTILDVIMDAENNEKGQYKSGQGKEDT